MSRLLLILAAISLLLSLPSLARIPRVLSLLDPEVRAAAPHALETLREKGLWLVNTDLLRIERQGKKTCFHWEHRYTARTFTGTPEYLTTCIDAPPA